MPSYINVDTLPWVSRHLVFSFLYLLLLADTFWKNKRLIPLKRINFPAVFNLFFFSPETLLIYMLPFPEAPFFSPYFSIKWVHWQFHTDMWCIPIAFSLPSWTSFPPAHLSSHSFLFVPFPDLRPSSLSLLCDPFSLSREIHLVCAGRGCFYSFSQVPVPT